MLRRGPLDIHKVPDREDFPTITDYKGDPASPAPTQNTPRIRHQKLLVKLYNENKAGCGLNLSYFGSIKVG
jgi:hypothetical protein